jgi:hypothetical protein
MELHVIDFSPPMSGFESFFNTFRLGIAWAKRVQVGELVLLMDNKAHTIFGCAEVISVKVGKLGEMAALHAAFNHNQLGAENPAAKLIEGTIKRYGPHRVNVDKKYTVIYMRRVPCSTERFLQDTQPEGGSDNQQ